jgi:hypothetical protein
MKNEFQELMNRVLKEGLDRIDQLTEEELLP